MTHRAAQPWDEGLFDGDENVIVDFKYSNSPKITWWFDHHQSAFLTPSDAEKFRKHPGPHMYYEPDFKSCTKLIATVAQEKFSFDARPLEELIRWGDIIDGAQYPTPQSAVEMADPATQLALVIEAAPENGLPARLIPELAYRSLAEMVKLPIVYLLHPECVYSVSVSASTVRAKVSLGTNPWNQAAAGQNLASLAEKFGGGGHPRVSAISFEPNDLPRAREVARELAAALRAK